MLGQALGAGVVWLRRNTRVSHCAAMVIPVTQRRSYGSNVTSNGGTVVVCASGSVPFRVAETVFISAPVELSVPVTRPLASVVAACCVSVFPTPLASNVTVAPGTGFPTASSAVTVSVDTLEPALAGIAAGSAVTRDCVLLGGPTVPVAVNVTGLPVSPVAVAVSVLSPGSSPSVQDVVAIPLALLEVVMGFAVPPPPVTSNRTPTRATGLPNSSDTITDGCGDTAVPTMAVQLICP